MGDGTPFLGEDHPRWQSDCRRIVRAAVAVLRCVDVDEHDTRIAAAALSMLGVADELLSEAA